MTPIQVIGVGLDGAAGLSSTTLNVIQQAAILAGSDRLLQHFPDHPAQRWSLTNLPERLRQQVTQPAPALVVVLTSGDPLFFGLGRQLLQVIPPELITFHPHVSSVQLAFSRAKLPWQDATIISAHGRSLDRLAAVVKKGASPIAVLTDPENTPTAIAHLLRSLGLPTPYQMWVCENLGGADERVRQWAIAAVPAGEWRALNVVILQRCDSPPQLATVPLLGIPDSAFLSFRDRPGLMTKRAVRVQILAELALQTHQVIWDIGAGTGSVSVELARLVPTAQVWAIERTTAGAELIRQNAARFETPNIQVVAGQAPTVLADLPNPDRVFIGGSHGQLTAILTHCSEHLGDTGVIVVALATLENQTELAQWQSDHSPWTVAYQQLTIARSVAVGAFTRWNPLNPVILATLRRSDSGQ
ncbi:precorrin-6y C5,15-methyltransferase (decarboxylating) subunit CbiE [Halomicronema sp. CCY15110]|uniref:precorrin-6y C5,15-methyltransferase (decarboxylating) subunit CbiE n=1 Tax=Halomicronema sp. CCY15110 TaxID=2767773 RepID=UPI001950BE66|nr:precorrin-6y C5,15-methyltransferase (decarboxylating) subunit CbiE [Halomicronema sp. CCY15110]